MSYFYMKIQDNYRATIPVIFNKAVKASLFFLLPSGSQHGSWSCFAALRAPYRKILQRVKKFPITINNFYVKITICQNFQSQFQCLLSCHRRIQNFLMQEVCISLNCNQFNNHQPSLTRIFSRWSLSDISSYLLKFISCAICAQNKSFSC